MHSILVLRRISKLYVTAANQSRTQNRTYHDSVCRFRCDNVFAVCSQFPGGTFIAYKLPNCTHCTLHSSHISKRPHQSDSTSAIVAYVVVDKKKLAPIRRKPVNSFCVAENFLLLHFNIVLCVSRGEGKEKKNNEKLVSVSSTSHVKHGKSYERQKMRIKMRAMCDCVRVCVLHSYLS